MNLALILNANISTKRYIYTTTTLQKNNPQIVFLFQSNKLNILNLQFSKYSQELTAITMKATWGFQYLNVVKQNQCNYCNHWQATQRAQWTNQKLKSLHTTSVKPEQMHAWNSWLVLVLSLNGWESAMSFVNQSQSNWKEKQLKTTMIMIIITTIILFKTTYCTIHSSHTSFSKEPCAKILLF